MECPKLLLRITNNFLKQSNSYYARILLETSYTITFKQTFNKDGHGMTTE